MKIKINKNDISLGDTGKTYDGIGISNRDVIESFRHLMAEKGPISDEMSLSKRELYFMLLRYRSYILSEKIRQRGFNISRHTYQTISCTPLVKVDVSECPIEEKSGCTWLKTKYPIPKPIGPFTSVVGLASNIKYDFLEWERFNELQDSRFGAEINSPYYTVKTTGEKAYLYLWNDNHKQQVQITGIFENPLDVQNFYDCETGEKDPCFSPLDAEFVLDADLLPRVFELAINQYARPKQMAQDKFNQDSDDVTQNPANIK